MNELPLSLGFSPCPNDTFLFHALVHGMVEGAPDFSPIYLEDVETLNDWALEGRLSVTKVSFHALGHALDHYVLLGAGAALGRGCGPLLVASRAMKVEELRDQVIAIPGRLTTAALLLKLYAPDCSNLLPMRFDKIMSAVTSGECAAGVIIHESRFTYQRHNLVLLADLGEWWETATGFPIPLGGIAARRSLGKKALERIEAAIAESVARGLEQPEAPMQYIRSHAQELDDLVIREHVKLYVNDFTRNLGVEGVAALKEFFRRARLAGAIPQSGDLPLMVGDL